MALIFFSFSFFFGCLFWKRSSVFKCQMSLPAAHLVRKMLMVADNQAPLLSLVSGTGWGGGGCCFVSHIENNLIRAPLAFMM